MAKGFLIQTYLEIRMSSKTQLPSKSRAFLPVLLAVVTSVTCCAITGCQDGPLYALKAANPYFSLRQWKEDEAIGVTDHERRAQLQQLAAGIGDFDAPAQEEWLDDLNHLMDTDASPEMRRLAVLTAGNIDAPAAVKVLEKGLDDDSIKVRMEACRGLGNHNRDENVQLLAQTAGSETSVDVKHAAMKALQEQSSPQAVEALRLALADRNPATQNLAIASLRETTGKDYGDDPDTWIAALDGKPIEERPTRFADRLRDLF
jgi:hypothetical protein